MSLLEELESIRDRHGNLTPEIVVNEAADPDHPLHSKFVWDDTEAARLYRNVQAQLLIRRVMVSVTPASGGDPIRVRAFISRTEIDPNLATSGDGSYIPVSQVMESDVDRDKYLRQLEREWQSLKRRAHGYREFAEMVLADVREMAS